MIRVTDIIFHPHIEFLTSYKYVSTPMIKVPREKSLPKRGWRFTDKLRASLMETGEALCYILLSLLLFDAYEKAHGMESKSV